MGVAELDREEVVSTRFAIVSDGDGETNFRLPISFVTALTFLVQRHLTTLNFRMKDKLGSQCVGEHKWLVVFVFKLVTFVTPLTLFCRVI
jgi:hypothetical protein